MERPDGILGLHWCVREGTELLHVVATLTADAGLSHHGGPGPALRVAP